MDISIIKVMQAITINSSSHVSALETAIQDRLGPPFNNIPLRICQIHPESVVERPMDPQTPISSFFPEEAKANSFNILEQNLKLEEKHYDILCKKEITSQDFLDMTEEKFRSYDDNKVFKRCMEEILGRLRSYGTLQPDSLEAMRNEYVIALLHASIHIVIDITNKDLSMKPQYGIVEDKQHKVPIGFAQNIKQLESACETNKKKRKRSDNDFDYLYGIVTTGRDWHFLLYSPEKISKASDTINLIEFSRKALKPNSKSYQSLCDSVKECIKLFSKMASEIDLLRQENTRLMAENAKFKAKYDEAKDEITKLRAELRNRIEELEKARIDTIAENTRRDVENTRHDAENAELKARVAKLKEDSRQPRKDASPEKSANIPDSIVANETVSANSKSSEEKIMDSFLDEVNKKRISDGIRQKKREEKLAKMETIFPEKDEQVSVNKRMLCKENQKKQREKFIQKVSEDDSIPSVSSQRASTNCSNIIDEPGFNSLDVCLEKTIRNCDSLAVEMGTPTFSLLYEKLCDAVTFADHATQEAIFCYY
ncbi:hypothetical protein GLOIN_2v1572084 [Rhizophagus clarus]|uniref:Uncharacterized protein n=1 Tax=Rhizophagus clarus TaxID=94130 RepID=A0A8H3QTE6_9GLOM|nr:hypothetical protein GLOIN_2v1572084 [Rhizophagus clarus]